MAAKLTMVATASCRKKPRVMISAGRIPDTNKAATGTWVVGEMRLSRLLPMTISSRA
ncbi:hypothetical protein D3C85_1642650 [compost metagenome]